MKTIMLPNTEPGEFVLLPVGNYTLRCQGTEEKESQAGNPMIVFLFEVASGPYHGASLSERCVIQNNALWKLQLVLKALGCPYKGQVKISPEFIEGHTCQVTVGHRLVDGKEYHDLSNWQAVSAAENVRQNATAKKSDDMEIPF